MKKNIEKETIDDLTGDFPVTSKRNFENYLFLPQIKFAIPDLVLFALFSLHIASGLRHDQSKIPSRLLFSVFFHFFSLIPLVFDFRTE